MNRWAFFICVVPAAMLAIGEAAVGQIAVDPGGVIVVAANSVENIEKVPGDMPLGQSTSEDKSLLPDDGDLFEDDFFGIKGGYVHPLLSIRGEYTDNLFNVDTDTTSNFLTAISPGIWFSMPRKKQVPVTIVTNNSSAGGLQLEGSDYGGTERYQLYASAGADFKYYSEDSDLNDEDYFLEGFGRYNMPGGLSLQLLDRYAVGFDRYDVGSSTADNMRQFDKNLLKATVDLNIFEKFRAKVDYAYFVLDYDGVINNFLDRDDKILDLYAYYLYSVKTAVFLEYRNTQVDYDTAIEKDNMQHSVFAGIHWDTTDKLSLRFKAGVQSKEFDTTGSGFSDSDQFAVDLQALYRLSEKTETSLDVYRAIEESDSTLASEKVVTGAKFAYSQRITEKITGRFDLFFENADYEQLVGSDRDEDRYSLRPALRYFFKEWLMTELAYEYEQRDSSDDLFDYETNTVFLSLNLAL